MLVRLASTKLPVEIRLAQTVCKASILMRLVPHKMYVHHVRQIPSHQRKAAQKIVALVIKDILGHLGLFALPAPLASSKISSGSVDGTALNTHFEINDFYFEQYFSHTKLL